jgi:hypothetical protein
LAAVPGNPNAQEPSKLSQVPYLEMVGKIISKLIGNSLIVGPKHIADIVNEEEDDQMVIQKDARLFLACLQA